MSEIEEVTELDTVPLKRTSREHYERVLQHLVSFVSVSVSFFTIFTLLLAQTEMAKRSGEREVWQLGKISVVLQCRNKPITCQQRKGNTHTDACIYSEMYLPVLVQLEEWLVLSGPHRQEVNEQKHAQWVRIWVQAKEETSCEFKNSLSK